MRYAGILLGLLLTACAATGSGTPVSPGLSSTESSQRNAGFTAYLHPDSYSGSAPQLTLNMSTADEITTVTVRCADPAELSALLLDVSYDPARFTPLSASIAQQSPDCAELVVLDDVGTVHYGLAPRNSTYFKTIPTGPAVKLTFAYRPFAGSRRVSAAPTTPKAAPLLRYDIAAEALEWDLRTPGDYDLTPLGSRLNLRGPFVPGSIDFIVDSDGNGIINISDLTPIGANYGARITGYNLYEADHPSQIPGPTETSTLTPLQELPFSTGSTNGQRRRFSHAFAGTEDKVYWLRPTDGTTEGTPSNYLRFRNIDPAAIELSRVTRGPERFVAPEGVELQLYLENEDVLAQLRGTFAPRSYFRLVFSAQQLDPYLVYSDDSPVAGSELGARRDLGSKALIYEDTGEFFHIIGTSPASEPAEAGVNSEIMFAIRPQPTYEPLEVYPTTDIYDTSSWQPEPAWSDSASTLSWYYLVRGDCDQDGHVQGDDIVVLDLYFNEKVAENSSDPLGAIFAADVNNDGIITPNDLGPIGTHFNKGITGYYVYNAPAPPDGPSPEPIGHVSLDDAMGNPYSDLLRFEFPCEPAPGSYLWVATELNGTVGIPSDAVQVPAE
jgi:hypothetical protein